MGALDRLDRFVALATVSTSADPWRSRLAALAAVRVEREQPATSFESLVRPTARVPSFVLRTTGLSAAELEEAPGLADLIDELRLFLGELPVVGVEIEPQLERLNRELELLGMEPIANRPIELLELAREAGQLPRRPSLPALAARLGLQHPRPYLPRWDARIIALVVPRLEARQDVSLIPRRPRLDLGNVLRRVDPPSVPRGPGVYLFHDAKNRVLYVGKATDLTSRVRQYHRRQLRLLRRLEGLAERVTWVETRPTTSTLEASLLEARLIREHSPPYNHQRASRLPALYLRLDHSPEAATLTTCAAPLADGAQYFGPFASGTAAGRVTRLLREALPVLRRRSRRGASERLSALSLAAEFLAGRPDGLLDWLQAEHRRATLDGDEPAARRASALLRTATGYEPPGPSDTGLPDAPLLTIGPAAGRQGPLVAHVILDGRLVACFEARGERQARTKARRLLVGATLDQRDQTDQPDPTDTALVRRWLAGLGPETRLLRL
jgi:DNA polymerase III epsilon subunit-like protein